MKKQVINNYRIGFCFLFVLYAFLPNSVYAQWSFTATLIQLENCYGQNISVSIPSSHPTKAACESERRRMLNKGVFLLAGCRVRYQCTACTGSDVATSQQTAQQGKITIGKNEAFRAPNQGQATQNEIDSERQKRESLGFTDVSNNLTEDKEFNKTYQDKLTIHSGPIISPGAIVKKEKAPSLPEVATAKRRKIAEARDQIIWALEELKQIEKFCASSLDCGYYQERKEKAEQILKKATDKLLELKRSELIEKRNEYIQELELEKYKQQLPDYQNKFYKENIQKAIDYLNGKIGEIDRELLGLERSINNMKKNIAKSIDDRNSRMSYAEKQCEIAHEMIERGDKTGGIALLNKYAPIVAAESAYKNVSAFVADKTDALKEEIDIVKDMITGKYEDDPNVKKYQALTISNIYGAASAVTPDGPSQLLTIMSDAGKQFANNGSVSQSALVYNSGKSIIVGQIVNLSPVVSHAKQITEIGSETNEFFENLPKWHDAVSTAKSMDSNK
jgi:hypothetical protein